MATQFRLALPENLPRQSPDPISSDGAFHQPFRNNQREPGIRERIDDAVEHEALRSRDAA